MLVMFSVSFTATIVHVGVCIAGSCCIPHSDHSSGNKTIAVFYDLSKQAVVPKHFRATD